jgi:hypothetical protein
VRYVIELQIICREDQFLPVRNILRRHGRDKAWALPVKAQFEKSDPAADALARELQEIGYKAHVFHVPAFEPWEVQQAELLHLFIRAECGMGFAQWAKEFRPPPGTLVMDMREMRGQDIALTYSFDVVISERSRSIFAAEGLTGWHAQLIQHVEPSHNRRAPLYQLASSNELPGLAPETELHAETHERLPRDNPLFGTTGLFQRGPLYYRRQDLATIEDFNHTRELFGEAPEAHPYLILSQRAWTAFRKHKIPKVDVEPVVILG